MLDEVADASAADDSEGVGSLDDDVVVSVVDSSGFDSSCFDSADCVVSDPSSGFSETEGTVTSASSLSASSSASNFDVSISSVLSPPSSYFVACLLLVPSCTQGCSPE